MATLASPTARFVLPTRCLVGRSRDCDLIVRTRDVSARHAMIEWNGADWQLRDLGSFNGTWLDGQRLVAGVQPVVTVGARIRFGGEAAAWVVEDAAGPELMAACMSDDRQRLAPGGYLVLPGADAHEHCVYLDARGSWVAEREGMTRAIEDREILVTADATPWRVHLPEADPPTWKRDHNVLCIGALRLQLSYSRDEEHVEAIASCGGQRLDLKARAHHYLILILARQRLADQAAGVPAAEQGWVRQDVLMSMLRMTDNHIYIAIHRARAQLVELGVADAAALVERKPGTRLLRLGVGEVELCPR